MQNVKFEILHMPPENTNSVLVSVGADCVIFDAWGRVEDWKKLLSSRGMNLKAIYSTHGHSDHISAAPDLAKEFDIPWFLNNKDEALIIWGNPILDYFGLPRIPEDYKKSENISESETKLLGEIDMEVIELPGHSLGGVGFFFPGYNILITGDTLFRDGIGRYDLPGGDRNTLEKSIHKIFSMNLPDETYVVHGHGLDSTIEILKKTNPNFK